MCDHIVLLQKIALTSSFRVSDTVIGYISRIPICPHIERRPIVTQPDGIELIFTRHYYVDIAISRIGQESLTTEVWVGWLRKRESGDWFFQIKDFEGVQRRYRTPFDVYSFCFASLLDEVDEAELLTSSHERLRKIALKQLKDY